ncbi:hypothetical protein GF407_03800 [candidate division KSB1 bacterium]|nr:hypothetical protein [candidate division KSB1 bacterium]
MLKPVKYLLIITSLWIVFSCGKKTAPPVSESMQKQISLLPQNADMVGYINVKEISNSDIYKSFVDSMKINPLDPQTYLKQINLNLENARVKIEEVYIAYHDQEKEKMAPFIVAHGKTNLADYLGALKIKTRDFQIGEDKDFAEGKLYVINADDTLGVGFQDSSVMVMGNLKEVKSWFQKGKKNPKPDPDLTARLGALQNAKTGWFLVEAATLLENLDMVRALQNVEGARQIKTADLAFTMDKALRMNSIITSIDAENAEMIKDAIKGALASVKLSRRSDRELTDVVNKINVEQKDTTIEITAQLSLNEIQKLASLRR